MRSKKGGRRAVPAVWNGRTLPSTSRPDESIANDVETRANELDNGNASAAPLRICAPDRPKKSAQGPKAAETAQGRHQTQDPTLSKRTSSLVLPNFDDTFSRPPRVWPPHAGFWERAVGAVNAYLFPQSHGDALSKRSRITATLPKQEQHGTFAPHLHAEHEQAMPRTYKVLGEKRSYRRVKRVVVIGVHGWYSQSIFKTVIGAPIGTSIRLATMMADAVHRQFKEAHCELSPDSITVIAPQHDGRVNERADTFFDIIAQNEQYMDDLRNADAVFVAAHSQGSIVASLLLKKLLDAEILQPSRSQTCLLTMCGIYQGPFVHLRSTLASSYINYFETVAARELFDFQSSDAPISIAHKEAYSQILQAGVKCVHTGSIDDNVVPLYSALNSAAAHPSILRAVYIDGVAFPKTDFLIHLISLCVAVRNSGFHDHNLLTLLSASVAGSLYGGLGHSLIYDEGRVYDLATRYLFETNSPIRSGAAKISLTTVPFTAQRWNPYELPWCLRGLLEDKTIRHFYMHDITTLIQEYYEWHPVGKTLKDLRWRLSAIRTIPLPEALKPVSRVNAIASKL